MCYKRLLKLLIDHDMTRADLRKKTSISPVGTSVLECICESMQFNIDDIVDYVPNAKPKRKAENGT